MRQAPMTRQHGRALPRLLGLVLIACGLAVLMFGGYLTWNSLQARMALEAAAAAARDQAQQVERQIDTIRAAIQSEEFKSAAMDAGQGVDRNELIKALRANDVRNVLNIVVAFRAIEEVDLSAFPGRGFAALEMMFRARTEGFVPAQVHFVGTTDEYLAVAQALETGEAGGPVALVTLPVSVLVNRISLPETVEAMRLIQEMSGSEVMLEEFGASFGSANEVLPIEGSVFQLAWHRSTAIGPMSTLQLAGVAGIGLLMAVLGILIMRRSAPGALAARDDAHVKDEILPKADPAKTARNERREQIRRTEILEPGSLEAADNEKLPRNPTAQAVGQTPRRPAMKR